MLTSLAHFKVFINHPFQTWSFRNSKTYFLSFRLGLRCDFYPLPLYLLLKKTLDFTASLLIKMTKKMFMSPGLVRRMAGGGGGLSVAAASPLSPARRKRCEDEMDLILPSPTSEGSGDFVPNGNSSSANELTEPEIGFSLPKFRSPMPQRVSN